jgi:small subunit ribosomal protein S16
MLKIRLQRIGKKGQAHFRLIVTEHTQKPKGRFLEDLGNYDPHKNTLNAKKERVEYWMSKGAQLSATANNLLVGREIIKGEKVQVWKAKKKAEDPKAVAPATTVPSPETPAV